MNQLDPGLNLTLLGRQAHDSAEVDDNLSHRALALAVVTTSIAAAVIDLPGVTCEQVAGVLENVVVVLFISVLVLSSPQHM